MKQSTNPVTIIIALLVVAGLCGVVLWYGMTDVHWRAEENSNVKNDTTAMQHWLEQRQYTWQRYSNIHTTLSQPLPEGVMFIRNAEGLISPTQVEHIMDWVDAGNTLMLVPKYRAGFLANPADEEPAPSAVPSETEQDTPQLDSTPDAPPEQDVEQDVEQVDSYDTENQLQLLNEDPFGELFDVSRSYDSRDYYHRPHSALAEKECESAPKSCLQDVYSVRVPNLAYPLHLNPPYENVLVGDGKPEQLLFADTPASLGVAAMVEGDAANRASISTNARAVRVYSHGNGRVVLLADDYFDNRSLPLYDHAELLLHLLQPTTGGQFMLVENLDFLPWYLALWQSARAVLLALALALLVLLWMGLRRFGSLLPAPLAMRRAITEHIDASARWLWRTPGGADLLLAAARTSTLALLRRRIPRWDASTPEEQLQALQRASALSAAVLRHALFDPVARTPHLFTQQVQTLQILRKHYERP